MYAAARSQQAASQLALFEHEGAWDKALVSCDLMLPRGLPVSVPPAVLCVEYLHTCLQNFKVS